MKQIFVSILLMSAGIKVYCQPGSLDPTFSMNGKDTTLVGLHGSRANALAIQADGKIILAGDYFNNSHQRSAFAFVRYNVDGTLDHSFAGNGKAGINFGPTNDICNAVAIQKDGKIIAIGQDNEGPGSNLLAVRLNIDGRPDAFFGTNGKVRMSYGEHDSIGEAKSVAIQSDGKIVIGGYVNYDSRIDCVIFRFNTDGTIDPSFNNNASGVVLADFNHDEDRGESLVIQPDGKIVIAGIAKISDGKYAFGVARYYSNGTIDNSFGTNGKLQTIVGNGVGFASSGSRHLCSITLQNDGKILLAGGFYLNNKEGFAVVRYNIDGSLDNSFSANGKAGIFFSEDAAASSIAVQQNGKIIVAGYINTNSTPQETDFKIAGLNKDGSLDNNFGNGGKVTTDLGGYDWASSIAIQKDQKIIVAGTSLTNTYRFAVARYIGAGNSVTNSPLSEITKNNITEASQEKLVIKMYPNPVSNAIHFEGLNSYSATIIIRDALGNEVIKKTVSGTSRGIDVSSLNSGAYSATVSQNNRITILKFIKK